MKKILLSIACTLGLLTDVVGQTERNINTNNGMPNRISMNVTVTRQTQGATFGEKVNAGLHASGAYVVFPNKQAFLITKNTVSEMTSQEHTKVNSGIHATGSAIAQGASLVGGALPGGAIISAAVSKYGEKSIIWQIHNAGNGLMMPSNLADGEYELALDLSSGTKDTSSVQAVFVLLVEGGTYKVVGIRTKHDTAKNSVSNIR